MASLTEDNLCVQRCKKCGTECSVCKIKKYEKCCGKREKSAVTIDKDGTVWVTPGTSIDEIRKAVEKN
jgi:hypothetical protein